MTKDALYFYRFYRSPLGQEVMGVLKPKIMEYVRPSHKTLCLGYGFDYDGDASFFHAPLDHMGVLQQHGQSHQVALVDEQRLPFQDDAFDQCLLIHALEHTSSQKKFLREVWRVMCPGGRLVLVVPNRRGLWARFDNNPFGHGQPYTKDQALGLLESCLFHFLSHKRALFHPPISPLGKSFEYAENFFYWIFAKFSGVIVIEAEKQVYCPLIKGKRQTVMQVGLVGD